MIAELPPTEKSFLVVGAINAGVGHVTQADLLGRYLSTVGMPTVTGDLNSLNPDGKHQNISDLHQLNIGKIEQLTARVPRLAILGLEKLISITGKSLKNVDHLPIFAEAEEQTAPLLSQFLTESGASALVATHAMPARITVRAKEFGLLSPDFPIISYIPDPLPEGSPEVAAIYGLGEFAKTDLYTHIIVQDETSAEIMRRRGYSQVHVLPSAGAIYNEPLEKYQDQLNLGVSKENPFRMSLIQDNFTHLSEDGLLESLLNHYRQELRHRTVELTALCSPWILRQQRQLLSKLGLPMQVLTLSEYLDDIAIANSHEAPLKIVLRTGMPTKRGTKRVKLHQSVEKDFGKMVDYSHAQKLLIDSAHLVFSRPSELPTLAGGTACAVANHLLTAERHMEDEYLKAGVVLRAREILNADPSMIFEAGFHKLLAEISLASRNYQRRFNPEAIVELIKPILAAQQSQAPAT